MNPLYKPAIEALRDGAVREQNWNEFGTAWDLRRAANFLESLPEPDTQRAARVAAEEFDQAIVWAATNATMTSSFWVTDFGSVLTEAFDPEPASIKAALVRLWKRARGEQP